MTRLPDTLIVIAAVIVVACVLAGCAAPATVDAAEPDFILLKAPTTQPMVTPYRMPLLPPGFQPMPEGYPGRAWLYEHGMLLVNE